MLVPLFFVTCSFTISFTLSFRPLQCLFFVDPQLHIDKPENLVGAPTAIQIITTRMRDEECLGIARLVNKYLRTRTGDGSSIAKL